MVSYNRGYKLLKFFPAEVLGGIKMLKALHGPFPDCYFFPTGGINQNNFKNYLSLSNVYGVAELDGSKEPHQSKKMEKNK